MAKQQSEEERNIKSRARRRLIGAAALAIAVVVVLPMVLDREPKVTGRDIDLRIPAPDKAGEFVPGVALSKVADDAEKAASAVSPASAVVPAQPVTENHAIAVGKIAAKPVEVKPAEAKPAEVKPIEAKPVEAKPAEASKPGAKSAKYVVQVGAFAKAATAKQEADRLKAMGFKAYTEVVGGTTRVRLGPYADRGKADAMRKSLEKHDLHPVVKEAE
jgi:DedD protein